jgi:hypothetical protein
MTIVSLNAVRSDPKVLPRTAGDTLPAVEIPVEAALDDNARLRELCDQIDALLDAGDWHEAHRFTVQARNLSRRVHGVAPITLRANGGRRLW